MEAGHPLKVKCNGMCDCTSYSNNFGSFQQHLIRVQQRARERRGQGKKRDNGKCNREMK